MARLKPIERVSFGKIPSGVELPNLLDIQLKSYHEFLQADVDPDKRERQGLQMIFSEVFPVSDIRKNFTIEFVKYHLGTKRYSIKECRERNMTFAAPLKATMRLISREGEGDDKQVKDIIEQDVYLGEFPAITDRGTFVVNGSERVIVSQLHRSPGVFFNESVHANGKPLFSSRIIPYRGSWVEFNTDINDVMFVHIDSRRKLHATGLLRAIGYSSNEEILELFHDITKISLVGKKAGDPIGHFAAESIVDQESGEVVITAGEVVTEKHLDAMKDLKVKSLKIILVDEKRKAYVIINTLAKDPTTNREEALSKIYSLMRPGEPPTIEMAESLLEKLFFNEKRYDLGEVGRYMINNRLNLDIPLEHTTLDNKDFVCIIKTLVDLRNGIGFVDDIDHLGNRRVRTVGELLSNLFSVGLSRVARNIRERMSLKSDDQITPQSLVNARTVSSVIETFFGSSQLSQFMDQTNPLSELTHKRRLSALGPGGLTRERAGFEVRDVHHTHYGRLCPVETPEGPNIGLIASLATYARINRYGFIETPYRKFKSGKWSGKIEYLTADVEDRHNIAQANEPLDKNGRFIEDNIATRHRDDYPVVPATEVEYMDVSPNQLVSVAAALIPFLEHDDANRALMGSNMQRQGVPLLRTDAPLIGTGMEKKAATDAGVSVTARRTGEVMYADSTQIVVRPKVKAESDELGFYEDDTYELSKFMRSNQDTCINQRPIVEIGDHVEAGEIIADGPATDRGELALGTNVLVAFMPWLGYNFEDAIILSERLIIEDIFTSIHVEEFELQVRDTKRGAEEITREIPNVSEDALLNLDENGIIRTGAEVEAGDILVGKVTPKGETELSPEERLLRAIFGEKAGDVRDASMKAPPGMRGTIIDTKVFTRKERSDESKKYEKQSIARLRRMYSKLFLDIAAHRNARLGEMLDGKTANTVRSIVDNSVVIRSGHKYKKENLEELDFDMVIAPDGFSSEATLSKKVDKIVAEASTLLAAKRAEMEVEIDKVERGAELAPGVKQLVKVLVAIKRKISVGDKMAGRHGNKGVVSRIVPTEDMPYMEDGTPIDIILNPLGVPSRMNVGQLLETHLGMAAHKLGLYYASPVFDGASLDDIHAALKEAKLDIDGKTWLYDGRTGDKFDNRITVGYIYMLKLSHLVDDKIHARSIGPYSLVTQQPLGGKAQFGGQRFGEMEVWALEAYGAAYALQEMLTVKSDDVAGRSKIYESIVKGENPPEPGIPESFNVLVKELQALGLDVTLVEKE